MTDLVKFCEERAVPEFVVGDTWFTRVAPPARE
jgi:hypothetical protein